LKLSIGHRLFLAVLLSIMAVALAGVEITRWKLFDHVSDVPARIESEPLAKLSDALSAQYRQHHDWSFLPADSAKRKTWLREELKRSQGDGEVKPGARPLSPTVGYRIGLLDKDRHPLAGAVANPLIIAFTSIDTFGRHLVVDGKTVGYLILATPQNPDDELAVAFLIDQQRNLFIVAAISVLLSALVAAWLATHFRKPIRQLVDGARRLEGARFDTRLTVRRSDELGELAYTFNHLAARLEDIERSRQQWVADTAHELRTPLSVLRGQVEALQDGVRSATPENLAIMLRQVGALTKLVDELYQLARADIGQLSYNKAANDVWRLVQDVLDGFAEKFRVAGLAIAIGTPPAHSTVYCDVDRIRQVMTNLLENCVRYTAAGGRIEVRGIAARHELRIEISDSAPGVPEHALGRLGERFFRVEPSRNRQFGGTGLGLALSKQILDAHEGRLEFGPSPLGGLRVTVVLKLAG
jgi:two-component system, OmpR family, sensor histidine kinase BaeS